ncbi:MULTISPECIES: hypothetical protein [unclassified Pseudoalteromonas]|nr:MULTISPECIES: hypothetical protein [unclassified Pseudoalteromonas]
MLVIIGEGAAFSSEGNIKDMAERSGDFAGYVQTLEKNTEKAFNK